MADKRVLIDFVTGDNWEMPIALYERFQVEQYNFSKDGQTVIQQWVASLTKEDKELIKWLA